MSYFYSPRGEVINKEEFVKFYSELYFYLNRDLEQEYKIEEILHADELTHENIHDILVWKTGAVREDKEKRTIYTQWRSISTQEISEMLAGTKPEIRDPKAELEFLEDMVGVDGIGPVYAITLLYFITRGERPIYDKFAHLALLAIKQEGFRHIIDNKELAQKFHVDSNNMEQVYDDYMHYIGLMKDVFGEEYKSDRNIDRALWVYGHFFNETEQNKKRIGKNGK